MLHVAHGLGEHLLADPFYQFAQARELQHLLFRQCLKNSAVHLSATPPLGMSLGAAFCGVGSGQRKTSNTLEQARREFDNRAGCLTR